jgi:hypothetical protein
MEQKSKPAFGVRGRLLNFRSKWTADQPKGSEQAKTADFARRVLPNGPIAPNQRMPVPGATPEHIEQARRFTPTFLGPKVTPIDIDRGDPTFAINSTERTKGLKDFIEKKLSDPKATPETKRAMEFLHSKILEPTVIDEAEKEFWIDFIYWTIAKPRTVDDKQRTPWLRVGSDTPEHHANLSQFLPDVGKFVGVFSDTRKRFEHQLDELKINGPRDINEAYLYYKYIVRGECGNFLDDFQYFTRPEGGLPDQPRPPPPVQPAPAPGPAPAPAPAPAPSDEPMPPAPSTGGAPGTSASAGPRTIREWSNGEVVLYPIDSRFVRSVLLDGIYTFDIDGVEFFGVQTADGWLVFRMMTLDLLKRLSEEQWEIYLSHFGDFVKTNASLAPLLLALQQIHADIIQTRIRIKRDEESLVLADGGEPKQPPDAGKVAIELAQLSEPAGRPVADPPAPAPEPPPQPPDAVVVPVAVATETPPVPVVEVLSTTKVTKPEPVPIVAQSGEVAELKKQLEASKAALAEMEHDLLMKKELQTMATRIESQASAGQAIAAAAAAKSNEEEIAELKRRADSAEILAQQTRQAHDYAAGRLADLEKSANREAERASRRVPLAQTPQSTPVGLMPLSPSKQPMETFSSAAARIFPPVQSPARPAPVQSTAPVVEAPAVSPSKPVVVKQSAVTPPQQTPPHLIAENWTKLYQNQINWAIFSAYVALGSTAKMPPGEMVYALATSPESLRDGMKALEAVRELVKTYAPNLAAAIHQWAWSQVINQKILADLFIDMKASYNVEPEIVIAAIYAAYGYDPQNPYASRDLSLWSMTEERNKEAAKRNIAAVLSALSGLATMAYKVMEAAAKAVQTTTSGLGVAAGYGAAAFSSAAVGAAWAIGGVARFIGAGASAGGKWAWNQMYSGLVAGSRQFDQGIQDLQGMGTKALEYATLQRGIRVKASYAGQSRTFNVGGQYVPGKGVVALQ